MGRRVNSSPNRIEGQPHFSVGKIGTVPINRGGFSLLEIVLSLAILGGSMAVLGEAVRHGVENARVARDMTDAQLYCESKLAELEAGLLTTDPVSDVPIEVMLESALEAGATSAETGWLYSIDSELIDELGLVQVYITVTQDSMGTPTPVSFTISRLILDETLTTTTEDAATDDTSEML